MQRNVVTSAMPIEYINVFTASGWRTNFLKLSKVNSPSPFVKAKTTINTSGKATKIAKNIAYGHAHVERREKMLAFIG